MRRIAILTALLLLASLAFAEGGEPRGHGSIPSTPDAVARVLQAESATGSEAAGRLPAAVDWSASFAEPGSQGQQGSCTGWALAALKGFQEAREHGHDADELRFSPSFIYNPIQRPEGGSNLIEALQLVQAQGVAPLAKMPYDPASSSAKPDGAARAAALPYRIVGFRRVDLTTTRGLRSQLAAGNPVVISLRVEPAFEDFVGDGTYRSTGVESGESHALVVTGYDDGRAAFRVLNSWGTDWGAGGLAWVDYTSLLELTDEAYTAIDLVLPKGSHGESLEAPVADVAVERPRAATVDRTWIEHDQRLDEVHGMWVHSSISVSGLAAQPVRFQLDMLDAQGRPLPDYDGLDACDGAHVTLCTDTHPTYTESLWEDVSWFVPYKQLHVFATEPKTLTARVSVLHGGQLLASGEDARFEYTSGAAARMSKVRVDVNDGAIRARLRLETLKVADHSLHVSAYARFTGGPYLVSSDGNYQAPDGTVAHHIEVSPGYTSAVYDELSVAIPLDELHLPRGRHGVELVVQVRDMSAVGRPVLATVTTDALALVR